MIEGIDLSHYQSSTPPLGGYAFLFARATYSTWADDRYAMHIANGRKVGALVGAYHFGVNSIYTPIADQVRAFLAAAGEVDFYVLDKESDGKTRVEMSDADARAVIAGVHAAGKRIGLYHSLANFPNLGQDWNWVAAWINTPPSIPWAFWQYNGSPLDLDHFYGTLADLRLLAGKDAPMPGLVYQFRSGPTGVATVSVDGASLVVAATKALIPVPKGQQRRVYAHVALTPALNAQLGDPHTGTGDRANGVLIGEVVGTPPTTTGVESAFLLNDNVTFVADPADTAPAVNAALDHVLAAVTDVGKAIQEARPR